MSSYLDDDDIGDDEEEEEIENRRGGQMEEEDDDDFEQRVPHKVAELARASTPASIRGIRACKRCGILKTLDQFLNEGCENCPFLEMVS
jgi:Transcription elongation factor SPT4